MLNGGKEISISIAEEVDEGLDDETRVASPGVEVYNHQKTRQSASINQDTFIIRTQNIQSGLSVLGLATTMPESAPDTQAPSAPMLFRIAVRATVASLLNHESKVARLEITLANPEQTRPLRARRDRNDIAVGE